MADQKKPTIGLVGPCKSGKTVLKRILEKSGLTVRQIAQEHSYVQDMWRKIAHPDILIYLDVAYPTTLSRSSLGWSEYEYNEQIRRLTHAKEHADLVIDTNDRTPEQIAKQVFQLLDQRQGEE